ncbi:MAG: heparinase II/III family protein [Armatimonadota bacterium]|nr:heparinase II/III family protein [Armatimonadota bacterium]
MLPLSVLLLYVSVAEAASDAAQPKTSSALFPENLISRARENAAKYQWAADIQKRIVAAAQPWMKYSDDELWSMMFGSTIKRAWQVFSSGYCPACKKDVPMYTWVVRALERPWKVQCPHCKELFPKNDFFKYYKSGLDEHGVFDPKRADRSLLYNAEHPDPSDPLHKFGVDDGEGYVEGDKRWRFIGAYLIYGQWKQVVLGGIVNLAAAYVVTGDPKYAHKAGVLLDRVADVYPSMDFKEQGVMYEGPGAAGYVSTWHDACVETRSLAIAYDQVFEALRQDKELVEFLSAKARTYKLTNPKRTWADIQRNIEDNILRHAVDHKDRIYSNYPQTDLTVAIIKTVLGWPANRSEVMEILDEILDKATAVDGLTGEKGLAGYSAWSPKTLASILSMYARVDPGFIREACRRHPKLPAGYRFFVDLWCLGKYYPNVGDSGAFCAPNETYEGVELTRNPGLNPSGYSFLWELYEITQDPAFVQVLYRGNGYSVDGLPYDIFAEDPLSFQTKVKGVIDRFGTSPKVGSVNKEEWHIAVLRSGSGENERALWLNYESGGGHGHADGMNLGLYAKGLDLMSDFGYPQVQYGGWTSPRAVWYKKSAAHNTVVVDGNDLARCSGKTTLWVDGQSFRAVRVSAPEMIGGKQFERTAALIDVSETDSYVFDVFRVVGGTEHAKFTHACYGGLNTDGLSLKAAEEYGRGTLLRNFRVDSQPRQGWTADWSVEDRYKVHKQKRDIHLRQIDLTSSAEALTCEAWVGSGYNVTETAWVPCILSRRSTDKPPLVSTFVALIEPYEQSSAIKSVRRIPLEASDGRAYPDSFVAVEVVLVDGRKDVIIAADAENPLGFEPAYRDSEAVVQEDYNIKLFGEMCWVRFDKNGLVERLALCSGRSLTAGGVSLTAKSKIGFVEVDVRAGKVVAGGSEELESLKLR